MTTSNVTMNIKVRWWVKYYVATVELFCRTFDTEPNMTRIGDFIARYGVKITGPHRGCYL